MEKEIFFANDRDEILHGILFAPEKFLAGVAVCHGFAGRCDTLNKRGWARALAAKGFAVLLFDCAGHGKSEGEYRSNTISREAGDAHCALERLRELGCGKLGLVGHSMGGIVALIEGNRNADVKAVALVAAPFHLPKYPDALFGEAGRKWKEHGVLEFVDDGRKLQLDYGYKRDQQKYDAAKLAHGLKKPLLVLHGSADNIVPIEEATQFYAHAAEPKELRVIEGGDHGPYGAKQRAEAEKALTEFFEKRLA